MSRPKTNGSGEGFDAFISPEGSPTKQNGGDFEFGYLETDEDFTTNDSRQDSLDNLGKQEEQKKTRRDSRRW